MKHSNPFLKATLIIFFLSFYIFPAGAQICGNPNGVIYGLSNSGNIVPVTVSNTSAGTKLNPAFASTTSNANGIGYNPQDGKFYYFQNSSAGATQIFVSFDPIANTYTTLASAPLTSAVNRGCISFNGAGYYCLDQSANLCYYDILSNTWTLVTNAFTDQYGNNASNTFKSQGSGDIAIDGTGNMWIVSSGASAFGLYKIPAPLPTTATASVPVLQLIAPTTATPTGVNFAGIAFNSTGQIYICTPNDLYLLNNDYSCSHLGAFSVAGIGGDLTSCNFPISLLPVNWQSVTADLQNNNAVITWTVNQQANIKNYTVERSANGTDWNDLSVLANNGEMATAQTYSYTDAGPLSGANYYRIRETDMDGKTNISVIKEVVTTNNNTIAVWPNPAKDIIRIQQLNGGTKTLTAKVYNQSGEMVTSGMLKNGINTLNIGQLSAGYYIVHIDLVSGEKYNQKIVKL